MNPTPAWKRGRTAKLRMGKKLKEKREEYELTQTTVAKSIGCSPRTLSVLERGKFGSLELIESYAWALGLDLGDL
jgi:DNA-binding XRE family transcriptional regulator